MSIARPMTPPARPLSADPLAADPLAADPPSEHTPSVSGCLPAGRGRTAGLTAVVGVAALVLAGCGSPIDEEEGAQGAAEEETVEGSEDEDATPSNEPSAENPTSAEDVDLSSDVAVRAVNTALDEQEGLATGFVKDPGDDVGMEVDILIDGEDVSTVVVNQEGTGVVDTRDGDTAEDEAADAGDEIEVPLMRAMEIAQTESAGAILEAQLELRDDDLIVWVVAIEGLSTENTVVIDAGNGAIVPEGENPMEENGIGADPDTLEDEQESDPEQSE